MHLGDFDAAAVIYGKFSTYRPSTGATFTLAGTPALSVYKDNSTTQSTTGVTLTADFDSVTGLNHFAIDTSADGTFYSAGSFFSVVITTGTVDSISVTGAVVAEFTIRKNSALKPTTAARTLDVSATGEAGIDWANIGSPTTAVNLSGTNIDVDQVVASVSGAVGSVTGAVGSVTARVTANTDQLAGQTVTAAAGVTFPTSVASPTNITAGTITTATNVTTVNGLAAGVITATSIAADAITDAKVASDVTIASVTGAVGSVTGLTASDVGAIKTKTDFLPSATAGAAGGVFIAGTNAATTITTALTTTFTGNLTGSVGSVSGAVGSVTGNVGGNVTGSVGSIATGGITAASFAAGAIDAAAIATDALGALELAAGAASEIATAVRTELTTELGRIDAAVSTRASQTSLDTLDDFVDTEVGAIKTVTDKLDTALELDGAVYRFTTNALEQAPGGLTAAAIADAVWEEAIADHSGTAGSTAEALAAAGSADDPWITALPGAYTAGQAGYIIGTNVNATVSSRATQTSVDDVPTNAELATALGTADDAVLAILGTPVGASLSADVAAVKTQTAAIETDTQDIQSRLPAALVSGRIDASVGAMAANVMTAAAAAADLTTELQSGLATASALATLQTTADAIPTNAELATALGDIPTADENADALLNRDMATGTDTNARSPRNALRFLRNKWGVAGTTLTVTKEDDTTEAWTATVTATPGADPVTGSDPA
jgi:hypothetical protein